MMHNFDLESFYQLAIAGFRYELTSLIASINSSHSKHTICVFSKRKKLLELLGKAVHRAILLESVSSRKYDLIASHDKVHDLAIFNYVNISAACAFFDGWTIPVSDLQSCNLESYLSQAIRSMQGDKEEAARNIADRLNRSDTARVMMFLKLLGLLPYETSKMKILSLGAFIGTRDIEYMHQLPIITPKNALICRKGAVVNQCPPLFFGMSGKNARDIVLIDIDPSVRERYHELNSTMSGSVLALNLDVLVGLEQLAARVSAGETAPRDCLVLFRMEPMMLPDVDLFFKCLKPVLAKKAKFIMTVGAGDDDDAYKNRILKMDEIDTRFRSKGFLVRRFKWCEGEDYEKERQNPTLGIGNYCSYDIIYAEINRGDLVK